MNIFNKKLIKSLFAGFVLCSLSYASSPQPASENIHQIQKAFLNNTLSLTHIPKIKLPKPYDYLLTQPLMTNSIKTYFQRKPIINVLHSSHNRYEHFYTRLITMSIDKNAVRNNPEIAQKLNEQTIVELAYININFDVLSKKMILEILNTQIPFGQLLLENNIKTGTKDRSYFSTKCNELIKPLLNCQINSTLYGRKNTIYRIDNGKWVAKVIEILPAIHSD